MPHVCALITIAMQLMCVVDKQVICTDNESVGQLVNVPSCDAFRADPQNFMAFPKRFGNLAILTAIRRATSLESIFR
jgi:hypothetical protein